MEQAHLFLLYGVDWDQCETAFRNNTLFIWFIFS